MPDNYISTFEMEDYAKITSQLLSYRLDPFIRAKEKEEGANAGKIFPFVRGLRFSCLLIYAIREALSGSDLEVNWGQIIDDEGFDLSGEYDIIIHKKGILKNGTGMMVVIYGAWIFVSLKIKTQWLQLVVNLT